MRYLEYIGAVISFGTPWVGSLQVIAWAIGMIGPLVLGSGLVFGVKKTVLVLSVVALLCTTSLIGWWLAELDFWMHAPPPTNCNLDACDNDAEIRTLFLAGALLLPATIPSLLAAPVTLLVSFRRVFRKTRLA